MADCKYINKNGTCGLKGCYAYRHKCYTEDCCKCFDKPTNADRIRGMSDEEMVKFLQEPFCDRRTGKECKETFCGDCDACMLDWLRQPAEEVHDGQTI